MGINSNASDRSVARLALDFQTSFLGSSLLCLNEHILPFTIGYKKWKWGGRPMTMRCTVFPFGVKRNGRDPLLYHTALQPLAGQKNPSLFYSPCSVSLISLVPSS